MEKLLFSVLWILTTITAIYGQPSQNTTGTRRSGHRDSTVMAALQQIQLQLSTMEGDNQRQASRIQELNRISTRLETQKQDLIAIVDRSEARITQRLDDIKGDIRKVITLQEVMRDDVEKVQQNQLVSKVWLEEKLRLINAISQQEQGKLVADTNSVLGNGNFGSNNNDMLSSLQVLQTTVHSLRRMADTLQGNLATLQNNVTNLANLTMQILEHQKGVLPTKSYFQSSLQSYLTEAQERHLYVECAGDVQNHEPAEKLPKDCKEVQDKIQNSTGVYRIQPDYARKPFFAFCDMETEGGGWTVIQRRRDGSVDFLREWTDYKHGFGNVAGEFWLGNENLYLITHQGLYELRVDLKDFEDGHAYSKYAGFAVGSEQEKYMLKLLGPLVIGEAGDGLTYHASIPFSTIDMDNDRWEGGNCAKEHTGGWWYNQCDASNLNGQYLSGLTNQEYKGVYWHEWQGPNYSLMASTMMIRPIQYRKVPLLKESESTTTLPDTTIPTTLAETNAPADYN